MRVGYTWPRAKSSRFPKQLAVVVGLLVVPVTLRLEKVAISRPETAKAPQVEPKPDPRTIRLTRFFSHLHCPVVTLSEDFVHAADDNQLDWRLLPSISVIESGGGKAYRNNNIFGWGQGLDPFPTLRSAIHAVAFKLGKSPLYRDKDVVEKLRIYNPEDETYVDRVLTVMNRISPIVDLTPAEKLVRREREFVYGTD